MLRQLKDPVEIRGRNVNGITQPSCSLLRGGHEVSRKVGGMLLGEHNTEREVQGKCRGVQKHACSEGPYNLSWKKRSRKHDDQPLKLSKKYGDGAGAADRLRAADRLHALNKKEKKSQQSRSFVRRKHGLTR